MDLMVHNKTVPAVNQIEMHPFHQQSDAAEFLRNNKVQVEAWGPFAEGRKNIFQNNVLTRIAARHGMSIAQIILRWLTQRGVVAIPKSVRKDRMVENMSIFDFELSDEDIWDIGQLDDQASAFFDHRDPAMVKLLSSRKIHA